MTPTNTTTNARPVPVTYIESTPLTPSELSAKYPAQDIARFGGGTIRSYAGDTSRVVLDFEPRRPGFIWLTFAGKRALVHKDELLYFTRFAKGNGAI